MHVLSLDFFHERMANLKCAGEEKKVDMLPNPFNLPISKCIEVIGCRFAFILHGCRKNTDKWFPSLCSLHICVL